MLISAASRSLQVLSWTGLALSQWQWVFWPESLVAYKEINNVFTAQPVIMDTARRRCSAARHSASATPVCLEWRNLFLSQLSLQFLYNDGANCSPSAAFTHQRLVFMSAVVHIQWIKHKRDPDTTLSLWLNFYFRHFYYFYYLFHAVTFECRGTKDPPILVSPSGPIGSLVLLTTGERFCFFERSSLFQMLFIGSLPGGYV